MIKFSCMPHCGCTWMFIHVWQSLCLYLYCILIFNFRLLFDTGSNTVMAAYMVGVYSDKQLLGKGTGISLWITVCNSYIDYQLLVNLHAITHDKVAWPMWMGFLSPAAPKARDGRYCNAPHLSVRPSVCLSVCLSVRHV